MLKLDLQDVKIDQRLDIYRTGSIRGGTIKSGARALTLHIEIVSGEAPDRIAELVRVAKESCFTHGALAEVVPVSASLILNGQPLEQEQA